MTLAELVIGVTVDSGDAEREINNISNSAQSAGESAQSISAGTIALGNAMWDIMKSAASGIKNVVTSAISYNADMESYTSRLKTSLGSLEAAEQAIADIKQDAMSSTFDVSSLVEANSLLMSTGKTAAESRKAINALANAVAASGGGNDVLQRMASNLQQIQNVGQATTMDIRQFAMAGIDVYGILSEYTGNTVEELQEMDITYDMLTESLIAAGEEGGKYYGAMSEQAETFNSLLNKLTATVQDKLGQAFEGLFETIKPIMESLIEWIASIDMGDIENGVQDLATAFGVLTTAVLVLNQAMIVDKITTYGSALLTLAKNPIFLAVAGFAAIATGIRKLGDACEENGASTIVYEGTLEELNAQLEAAQQHYDDIMAEWQNNPEGSFPYEEWSEAKGALEAAQEAVDNYTAAAEEGAEATSELTAEEQALADYQAAFETALESAREAVEKYFDPFEKVDKIEAVEGGISAMTEALQTQLEFLTTYNDDLSTIANAGFTEIAETLQGMGTDGASYAAAFAQAIAEAGGIMTPEIEAMVEAFTAVGEAKEELAGTEALIETIMSTDSTATTTAAETMATAMEGAYTRMSEARTKVAESLSGAEDDFETTATDIQLAGEELVKGLDLYDDAFEAGANTVKGFVAGLASGESSIITQGKSLGYKAAQAVQQGVNSFGTITITASVSTTGSKNRSGLDYVPYDEFPALLHEGERVLTKSENKAYSAGEEGGGISIVQNISATPQTPAELASAVLSYFEEARWAIA